MALFGPLVVVEIALVVIFGASLPNPKRWPLALFSLVASVFGFVAVLDAFVVGINHMSTSLTEAESETLTLQIGGLLLAGVLLGGVAARWASRPRAG